jgi:hypothetical protein
MKKGMLCFAGRGPNTRLTDIFIAHGDIHLGDAPWEVCLEQERCYFFFISFYIFISSSHLFYFYFILGARD